MMKTTDIQDPTLLRVQKGVNTKQCTKGVKRVVKKGVNRIQKGHKGCEKGVKRVQKGW